MKSGRVNQAGSTAPWRGCCGRSSWPACSTNPYVDPERAVAVSNTPEHQALALEAARRSIVLLKNDNPAPARPRALKTLAVVGPNAKGVHLGGYSSIPGAA